MKNLFTLFLLLGSVSSRGALPDLKTAAFVDLNQYSGVWYEIAAIPQWFERNCVGNTKAEYARAELDLVSVVNSCDVEGGKRSVVKGRAKVIDTASNSKLEVTFVNIFGWQFLLGGNYWILSVGDNYSYAIVGEPKLFPNLVRSFCCGQTCSSISPVFVNCRHFPCGKKLRCCHHNERKG